MDTPWARKTNMHVLAYRSTKKDKLYDLDYIPCNISHDSISNFKYQDQGLGLISLLYGLSCSSKSKFHRTLTVSICVIMK